MNKATSLSMLVALLAASVRMSVPLLYATIGEIVSERSGVMNIGLEGQMLAGAFTAFVVTNKVGSLWVGILSAGLVGALCALIVAFLGVSRKQDQAVIGIMSNILILGMTSYLYALFYGDTTASSQVEILKNIPLPFLSKIPFLGPVFFNHTILTYLAVLLALGVGFLLYRTKFGFLLQTVGENPKAAQSAGVSVMKMRYLAVLFCGYMAGVGGSFLSIGVVGRYMENISAGRGFIALALTILVRWNPFYAILGSVGFGFLDAIQLRFQAIGIGLPYQFMVMLPYVVTLLSLIFLGRNISAPHALGLPYDKEER